MTDINTLKNKYFVQDANPPTEPVPLTFEDCKITPLIDCSNYNTEIESALGTVGTGPTEASNSGHFVLIASWWLGLSGGEYIPASKNPSGMGPQIVNSDPYRLDGPGGSKILIEILKEKARRGVDVRVLGWTSYAIMDSAIAQGSGAGSIARVNALTMKSIKDLRSEPKIEQKAILNMISHTAGSVHSKLVVIGNDNEAVGFTGGIDFEEFRWAFPGHVGNLIWHDVVAKVEGPGVQALYDWFQKMWHENIKRPAKRLKFGGQDMPNFLPETPVLPARSLPTTPKGKHHIQSLRTVPTFNYKWYNCLPESEAISFAQNGLFEYRVAIRKAITNAEIYIYMEDQVFWSQEILSWVNSAIKANSGLRVILMTQAGADPVDAPEPPVFLCNSINHGLMEGLSHGQRNQVRLYKRMGDHALLGSIDITAVENDGATSRVTTNIPASEKLGVNVLTHKRFLLELSGNEFKVIGNPQILQNELIIFVVENMPGPTAPVIGTYKLNQQRGIFIHSKTILIDDEWTYIGSANIMRRSLYTDLEHGVSVLDEDELMVKEYRKALWADHFRHGNPDDFEDIQESLHGWESSWGTAGNAPSRPSLLENISLPFTPDIPLEGKDKKQYDMYKDLDSRQEWGGLRP
jgi:phosphatidylserine/phosphatidylglycerophosphate/cardiolipin synthase-like enzyme